MTTTPDAHERLLSMGVTLLEVYTKSKNHHACLCNVCGNEWSATPHAIVQSNKKSGGNSCPACYMESKNEKRQANLQLLATMPHITVLTENYDGWIAFRGADEKVIFHNSNCGHTFETYPAMVLRGKSQCTVCGAETRSEKTIARNKIA